MVWLPGNKVFLGWEAGQAVRFILTQPRRAVGAEAERPGPAHSASWISIFSYLTNFLIRWVRPENTCWAKTARWIMSSESSRGAAPPVSLHWALFLTVACCNSRTQTKQKKRGSCRVAKTQAIWLGEVGFKQTCKPCACAPHSPHHFCFLKLQLVSKHARFLTAAQPGAEREVRFLQDWVLLAFSLLNFCGWFDLSICLSIYLSI